MTGLIVALRPKHWIKNFFIFLPLIFGSKLFSFHESLQTSVAFFIFSTSSSSVYLVNDVLDIESDRRHPVKLSRPIASGKVTVTAALVTAFILFRVLDIWKPGPIAKINDSHRASSIMWDDVVAGILGNLILQAMIRIEIIPLTSV